MTVNLDYIRLATWDSTGYTGLAARLMHSWAGDWKHAKWLQYKGWRKEEVFIGRGNQQDKVHCVLQASGSASQRLLNGLKKLDGWYCTRIDLQSTIVHPGDMPLRHVRDRIDKPNLTLIESQQNDTLYLGSRGSSFYMRLYEKPLEQKYLRLEFELKAERARACWIAIVQGEPLSRIYKYYLDRTGLPLDVMKLFSDPETDATAESMRAEIASNNAKKLRWLLSLDAAVMEALANHEIGTSARELIKAWCKHADHLDKLDISD